MCDGRGAAEQVFQSTMQELFRARDFAAGAQHRVAVAPRIDVAYPLADVLVMPAITRSRIVIEMQMIVGVDESRQQTVAVQLDAAKSRKRRIVRRGYPASLDVNALARWQVDGIDQ